MKVFWYLIKTLIVNKNICSNIQGFINIANFNKDYFEQDKDLVAFLVCFCYLNNYCNLQTNFANKDYNFQIAVLFWILAEPRSSMTALFHMFYLLRARKCCWCVSAASDVIKGFWWCNINLSLRRLVVVYALIDQEFCYQFL